MNEYKDISINNKEEYDKAIQIVKSIDATIGYCYSELEKITDTEKIVEFQQYINSLNIKRLGLNKLILWYDENNSEKNKTIRTYKVKMGDTLALIAQAFYGRSEYCEYIYYHNNLETMNLTVNQLIEIPDIHPENPNVFAQYQIENLDLINVKKGIY